MTTTRFPLLNVGFLSLLDSWLQSKRFEKSTAQTSFCHFKICFTYPPFCRKTHSRRSSHHSLMPARLSATPRCISSLNHKVCCCSRRPWTDRCLSIHCCCRFYSATRAHWFYAMSYAEIPAAVVKSEIPVVDFRQVAPLCYIRQGGYVNVVVYLSVCLSVSNFAQILLNRLNGFA